MLVLTDALPAASVCVAARVWPLIWGGSSVRLNVPSAATSAEPSTTPAALVTVTVAPGSPVPVRVLPSAVNASAPGAPGAVVSAAIKAVAGEVLPDASVCVALRVSPLVWGGFRVRLNVPSAATSAEPSTTPAALVTVTVAPGSPVPVKVLPSAANARAPGAAGAVISGAVITTGSELLPAPSVTITSSDSPLACGAGKTTWKLPSASTVPVPTTLPWASRMITVALVSALPETLLPSAAKASPVGAVGAVVSVGGTGGAASPPPPPPPPPDTAAVVAPAPNRLKAASIQPGVALLAAAPANSNSSRVDASEKVKPVKGSP